MKVLSFIGAILIILYCGYFIFKIARKYSASYNSVDSTEVIVDATKIIGMVLVSVILIFLSFGTFQ